MSEPIREASGRPAGAADLDALYDEVRSWFAEAALTEAVRLGGERIERIALEWLSKAGKRYRPFLSACMFRALGAGAASPVREVSVALECIHKASLIYDDVQDADAARYGEPTVHAVHGVPVALTASLLLLGEGYRLLAECDAPPEVRGQMLSLATRAHCELCLGQGAELLWARQPGPLTVERILEIFRRKTAPSFEVVFRLPAFCAHAEPDVHHVLTRYSIALGTAYQVRDDLNDYDPDAVAAGDGAGTLSIVLAAAHERARGADRDTVAAAWRGAPADAAAVRRVLAETRPEEAAREVLAQCRAEAVEAIRSLDDVGLRLLLARLADKVLGRDEG